MEILDGTYPSRILGGGKICKNTDPKSGGEVIQDNQSYCSEARNAS